MTDAQPLVPGLVQIATDNGNTDAQSLIPGPSHEHDNMLDEGEGGESNIASYLPIDDIASFFPLHIAAGKLAIDKALETQRVLGRLSCSAFEVSRAEVASAGHSAMLVFSDILQEVGLMDGSMTLHSGCTHVAGIRPIGQASCPSRTEYARAFPFREAQQFSVHRACGSLIWSSEATPSSSAGAGAEIGVFSVRRACSSFIWGSGASYF